MQAITFEKIIVLAIFLLVAFPVHEFAHAFVAYQLGDGTAKMFGRLTLNPIAHFDPLGGLMLIISAIGTGLLLGWAKPTPVNPMNLRDRRNGEVLVALAGPASNLIMACVAALVFRLLYQPDSPLPFQLFDVIWLFVLFNVGLAVFNLIPVPPLDGSTLLFRFVDPRTAWQLRPMLAQYGLLIIIVAIFVFGNVLADVIGNVALFLVGQ